MGEKHERIRKTFALSAVRYYQLLNDVLDDRAALKLDPVVVNRLRRIRADRVTKRAKWAFE